MPTISLSFRWCGHATPAYRQRSLLQWSSIPDAVRTGYLPHTPALKIPARQSAPSSSLRRAIRWPPVAAPAATSLRRISDAEQIQSEAKTWSAVALQRVPRELRRVQPPCGLNVRSFGLQQFVHRVAVHLLGAAGAPSLAIQIHQPVFRRILIARTARNQHRPETNGNS